MRKSVLQGIHKAFQKKKAAEGSDRREGAAGKNETGGAEG